MSQRQQLQEQVGRLLKAYGRQRSWGNAKNFMEVFMNAQEHLKRGIEFFNQDNFDWAISEFNEALSLEPDLVAAKNNLSDAYFNRGVANFRKGDVSRAIADLSEAAALTPNDAQIYGTRGYMNSEIGNIDEAINNFTEAIRLEPAARHYSSRSEAYYEKCKEARSAGDKNGFFKYIDLNIKDLEAVLQFEPTDENMRKLNEIARKQLELSISEREHRKQVYEAIG